MRVVRAFIWIIHELEDVILSEAPAKTFRPASFAGRAGAQSKDPYYRTNHSVAAWRSNKAGIAGGQRDPSTPRCARHSG